MPGRHVINSGLALGNVAALVYYMMTTGHLDGISMLGITSVLSSIMGVTLTMAIGGD